MINELFRTQSGIKFKTREPVLKYLDKIVIAHGYASYLSLPPDCQRHAVALLLQALDRYCEADWMVDHRAAAIINQAIAEQLIDPDSTTIAPVLMNRLMLHVSGYYSEHINKYVREKAESERVKAIIEKRKEEVRLNQLHQQPKGDPFSEESNFKR